MKDVKLNKGHYHEALDRTWMMADMIESYLLGHWVMKNESHKDIREKVEKAQELLAEVYQDLGQFM